MNEIERGSNFSLVQDRMNFEHQMAHLEDKIVLLIMQVEKCMQRCVPMWINDAKFPCWFLARRIHQSPVQIVTGNYFFELVFNWVNTFY